MTIALGGGDTNYIAGIPDAVVDNRPLVGVGLPAGPVLQSSMAFAWGCLHGNTKTARILPIIMMGQDPAQARNQMADAFMQQGCEAMLFIDCDMMFPPNGLDRLFAHDLDIVAADYRKRAAPFSKIGAPIEVDGGFGSGKYMPDPPGGLVERNLMGLGFMMIRRRVFEGTPRPWFARIYDGQTAANSGVMTEDYWFCLRAREQGFRVWCDLDLTKEVAHIGEQPVPWIIPGFVEQIHGPQLNREEKAAA